MADVMTIPCPVFIHHWWQWHPPVGSFIAVLGVIGVLVPWFRGDASRREKAMWTIAMFTLLGLELRTLYRDRAEHDEEQATARCQQLQSFQQIATSLDKAITQSEEQFKQTAHGLDATISDAEQAIKNTTPYADVQFDETSGGGPSTPLVLVFDRPLLTNVFYHNGGTDIANDVTAWFHYYIGTLDDPAAQDAIRKQFDKDWVANLKSPSFAASIPPGSPARFGTFSQTLTGDDLKAIQNGKTIYGLLRFSYSDKTGHWFSDYCMGYQEPLRNMAVSHPCLYLKGNRHRATR